MNSEDQIQNIQQKLQQLLKLYQHIQKENLQLKETLLIQHNALAVSEEQIQHLQMQLSAAQLASSTQNDTQRIELQKRIEVYLKEIDRCLALLKTK